jgi:hypothetical protein
LIDFAIERVLLFDCDPLRRESLFNFIVVEIVLLIEAESRHVCKVFGRFVVVLLCPVPAIDDDNDDDD